MWLWGAKLFALNGIKQKGGGRRGALNSIDSFPWEHIFCLANPFCAEFWWGMRREVRRFPITRAEDSINWRPRKNRRSVGHLGIEGIQNLGGKQHPEVGLTWKKSNHQLEGKLSCFVVGAGFLGSFLYGMPKFIANIHTYRYLHQIYSIFERHEHDKMWYSYVVSMKCYMHSLVPHACEISMQEISAQQQKI